MNRFLIVSSSFLFGFSCFSEELPLIEEETVPSLSVQTITENKASILNEAEPLTSLLEKCLQKIEQLSDETLEKEEILENLLEDTEDLQQLADVVERFWNRPNQETRQEINEILRGASEKEIDMMIKVLSFLNDIIDHGENTALKKLKLGHYDF